MFGPSFHQRTVSVGFSVCGLEWPPETPAAPRPQFAKTRNHTKYINLNRMIQELHKNTVGRVVLRDSDLIIREQEPCPGRLKFGLIYTMISKT